MFDVNHNIFINKFIFIWLTELFSAECDTTTCSVPCDRVCMYYHHTLQEAGQCKVRKKHEMI